jgi:hypothetical protein
MYIQLYTFYTVLIDVSGKATLLPNWGTTLYPFRGWLSTKHDGHLAAAHLKEPVVQCIGYHGDSREGKTMHTYHVYLYIKLCLYSYTYFLCFTCIYIYILIHRYIYICIYTYIWSASPLGPTFWYVNDTIWLIES